MNSFYFSWRLLEQRICWILVPALFSLNQADLLITHTCNSFRIFLILKHIQLKFYHDMKVERVVYLEHDVLPSCRRHSEVRKKLSVTGIDVSNSYSHEGQIIPFMSSTPASIRSNSRLKAEASPAIRDSIKAANCSLGTD